MAASGGLFDLGLVRPPGYPLFVRAVFEVFGTHYVAVVAVQVVLSAATVALTFWLASLFVSRRFALAAATAVAIDPASIVFANLMLTEAVFALLLTAAIGLVLIARRGDNAWLALAAGVLLGVAVLVRPVGEYLPIVLLPALVLAWPGRRARSALLAAVVLAGFAMPVGAWVARNVVKTGVPTVSTIDGHNMLHFRAVGALVEDGMQRQAAQHYVLVRLGPHVRPGDNQAEISRAELGVGLAILSEHLAGAVKSWARGEAKLLLGPGKAETATLLTGDVSVHATWLRVLILVDYVITIAIVAAGLIGIVLLMFGRLARALWLPAAAVLYLVVVSGGPEAYSRFRVPITPLLAVLGAAAFARWRRPLT